MNHGASVAMRDTFGGRGGLSLSMIKPIKQEAFYVRFLANLWLLWYFVHSEAMTLCAFFQKELFYHLPGWVSLEFLKTVFDSSHSFWLFTHDDPWAVGGGLLTQVPPSGPSTPGRLASVPWAAVGFCDSYV